MNYIVTVKYDPGVPKQYVISADSAIDAKKEFIRQNGYDPGVPISVVPQPRPVTLRSPLVGGRKRLDSSFDEIDKGGAS